jgi:hypothetical protein
MGLVIMRRLCRQASGNGKDEWHQESGVGLKDHHLRYRRIPSSSNIRFASHWTGESEGVLWGT